MGRHQTWTAHLAGVGMAVLTMCGSAVASAALPIVDCPLRDRPYSVDAPVLDVLLNPATRAVFERALAPGSVLPAQLVDVSPPTFAAILTPRMLLGLASNGAANNAEALNRELAAIVPMPSDKDKRCARYDIDRLTFGVPTGRHRLLIFEKMTGYRDGPSVDAARAALTELAKRNGWSVVVTDKGGAMNAATLTQFDAVVWNNVSGDVLTLSQRDAFRRYIEGGGGFVGIHGAGGDPYYLWDWYVDDLIGARFIGHPSDPQFQWAAVNVNRASTVGRRLSSSWTMVDEWYSFKPNPSVKGATIVASLDETTYSPVSRGRDIAMGKDHPIAWMRCVGAGRSFYSAIGHRPETYVDANNRKLLEAGLRWAMDRREAGCPAHVATTRP